MAAHHMMGMWLGYMQDANFLPGICWPYPVHMKQSCCLKPVLTEFGTVLNEICPHY